MKTLYNMAGSLSPAGELHGDLLWTCAWPAESQKQRKPACQRAPSDGTLRWRSVQASRHFIQRHPGPDGLWKQGQVNRAGLLRLLPVMMDWKHEMILKWNSGWNKWWTERINRFFFSQDCGCDQHERDEQPLPRCLQHHLHPEETRHGVGQHVRKG